MKTPSLLTLGGLTFVLVSCGSVQDTLQNSLQNIKQPLTGATGFNPLGSPATGSGAASNYGSAGGGAASLAPNSPNYQRGQWVETSLPSSTFFRKIPVGSATARADRVLDAGTPMKVVKMKGAYVNVQLESGDVGYVPQIMVIERGPSSSIAPPAPSPNPIGPVPEYGSVPPVVEPNAVSAPIPELPDIVPPLPDVPEVVPTVPDIVPPVPDVVPSSVPFVAPPPEIPGIGAPVPVE